MTKCAKKLEKDALHYQKKSAKTPTKKAHNKIEEKEAENASKDLRRRAAKSHEY